MQIRRKNVRVLVDGSVLDDLLSAFLQFSQLSESRSQEENLQIERPTLHVLVEIIQVRVVIHLLEMRLVAVVFCEERGQRSLSRPDVSGDGNVHNSGFVEGAK